MGTTLLGLQGTVDYEVQWDTSVVQRLLDEHHLLLDDLDMDAIIDSERALLAVLLARIRQGAGGERYVTSSDIVERFASRFQNRITLGGTSVRAGLVLRDLGFSSTLHLVSTDPHTRRLLPPGCRSITSADGDSLHPHLILQYPRGTRLRVGHEVVVAPRDNRLIVANDPPARELRLSAELPGHLRDTSLFLVSGMNTIQDPDVAKDRLTTLQEGIAQMPPGAMVIYEDAGFHRPELAELVRESMGPVATVYGMNEDEFALHLGAPVDILDGVAVAAGMLRLRELIPDPVLVVHTQYWAGAFGSNPGLYVEALRSGVIAAATRYRHGDRLTPALLAETARQPEQRQAVRVAAKIQELLGVAACVVPGLNVACEHPVTVGLGDAFVGGFIASLRGWVVS